MKEFIAVSIIVSIIALLFMLIFYGFGMLLRKANDEIEENNKLNIKALVFIIIDIIILILLVVSLILLTTIRL